MATPAETPSWPDDAIEVGRIVAAWGIKGSFKVLPHAPDPRALIAAERWFLQPAEASGGLRTVHAVAPPPILSITTSRKHGEAVVASAAEVKDRTAAEALRGARVFVSRSIFPGAEDGEYYWIDLIGLDVVNRQGESLGTVVDLIDTGPHSVLRLTAPGAEAEEPVERLIPFVAAYVDDVSLPQRRITVDWGLDY
jgi:16S rRNA processing protein RimM